MACRSKRAGAWPSLRSWVLVKGAYTHEVGHCDRSGTVLEPWSASSVGPMIAALGNRRVKVARSLTPRRYTDVTALDANIKDWCNQPRSAGTRDSGVDVWQWHASVDRPTDQLPDWATHAPDDPMLSTGSARSLAVCIFRWPEPTPILRSLPTDLLVTGRDIIFLCCGMIIPASSSPVAILTMC